MIKIFIFLIGLIICFKSGNCQQAVSKEEQKKYLPKGEPKYFLSKGTFRLEDTSITSKSVLYINTSTEEVRKDYKVVGALKSYTVMRFFNDGRVFMSFSYLSFPTTEELNDLTYGKFGRYRVKNGEIKIEMYMDRYDKIMYIFAKQVPKGIQFFKATGRGLGQILKVRRTTDDGLYEKYFLKTS